MRGRAVILFWFVSWISLSQAAFEIVEKRYPIRWEGAVLQFPFAGSHDLSAGAESVENLIFAIHSSSYNAADYYDNALAVVKKAGGNADRHLIIAPHFLSAEILRERAASGSPADLLYWKVRPFWGTSQGVYNGRDVRISSFDVIDQILGDIACGGKFPNLKTVVILGHSAGGQMVGRYAAGNEFELAVAREKDIEVQYLVMAPSSYVYFTPERYVEGTGGRFSVLENPPKGFNDWGYGLENLYSYHRRHEITPERIRQRYPMRRVLYLVGENDCNPDDSSLARGPAAMLQGRHRLVRWRIYRTYLEHVFGVEIGEKQRFLMVRGAGHWGRALMTSPAGVAFITGQRAVSAF